MPRSVSIVVPFYNEEDTLEPLYEQICAAFAGRDCVFELILVNDGSTDLSAVAAQKLASSRPGVRLINFRTNFGKAAALSAGFERARRRRHHDGRRSAGRPGGDPALPGGYRQ